MRQTHDQHNIIASLSLQAYLAKQDDSNNQAVVTSNAEEIVVIAWTVHKH